MGAAPEPRWLSDEEMQAWLVLAGLMIRLPSALDTQLRQDAGISHFEYQVLAVLSMSAQRTLRMSVLASFAEGSLSRLSQVVGRLESRGWVRRTPDPDDGRYTLAILTDAGWEKVVASAPGHVEAVRQAGFSTLGIIGEAMQEHVSRLRYPVGIIDMGLERARGHAEVVDLADWNGLDVLDASVVGDAHVAHELDEASHAVELCRNALHERESQPRDVVEQTAQGL